MGLSASAELLVLFGLFGLKLPIHARFGDMMRFPLELGTVTRDKTRSSADADKPARRVWKSIKVNKHSTQGWIPNQNL